MRGFRTVVGLVISMVMIGGCGSAHHQTYLGRVDSYSVDAAGTGLELVIYYGPGDDLVAVDVTESPTVVTVTARITSSGGDRPAISVAHTSPVRLRSPLASRQVVDGNGGGTVRLAAS